MLALVAAARLVQFAGAVILFGAPLFFLYGLPTRGLVAAASLSWPRTLFLSSGLAVLLGAFVALATQTATMTGDASEAFNLGSVWTVLTGTQFGLGIGARAGLTLAALLLCLLVRPARSLWLSLAAVGAGALASFAWTGHGAADEGAAGLLHAAADVVHLWAAGVWLGALAVLAMLLTSPSRQEDQLALEALHRGLAGFSGIGTAVVAALVLTGLVNSWFLVGPANLPRLFTSPYGLLLVAKLVIFAGMLGLAAVNRFVLTPGLAGALAGGSTRGAIRALRLSVGVETSAALAVIALVSVLGVLVPVSAASEAAAEAHDSTDAAHAHF